MTPKSGNDQAALTRRERQIMDILYKRGRATANEVMQDLSGDPHYSTVRTQLRILEEKGHISHEEEGLRYVYMPAVPGARRENPPFGISSTRFSMAPLSRSLLPCWAAKARSYRTRNWIASVN